MSDVAAVRDAGGIATAPAAPGMERVVVRGLQAGIDSQVTRGAVAVQLVAMLHAVLERLTRDRRVEVRVHAEGITVNGFDATTSTEDRPAAARLAVLFQERALAGIDFTHGVSVDELTDAFRALANLETPQILRALERAGVKHVTPHSADARLVAPTAAVNDAGTPPRVAAAYAAPDTGARGLGLGVHRALARHAYAQLVTTARDWYAPTGNGAAADAAAVPPADDTLRLLHTKRAVQRVIDLMHEDDACIVGLAGAGAGGSDLAAHAARVCVLALTVARHAGHERVQLQTVALAALLHDVGVGAPASAAEHTAAPPAALRGAARLLETLPAEAAAPAVLAALAPETDAAPAPSPNPSPARTSAVASLVRIADLYDQLVHHAASHEGTRPDAALHFVFQHGARAIDALLAQRFAAALGVYPPGSVVTLDGGETAVVVRANASSVDRPQVLVVRDAAGTQLDGSVVIDLAARRPDGAPTPTITAALDPAEAGIDPLEYFLAEPPALL